MATGNAQNAAPIHKNTLRIEIRPFVVKHFPLADASKRLTVAGEFWEHIVWRTMMTAIRTKMNAITLLTKTSNMAEGLRAN